METVAQLHSQEDEEARSRSVAQVVGIAATFYAHSGRKVQQHSSGIYVSCKTSRRRILVDPPQQHAAPICSSITFFMSD